MTTTNGLIYRPIDVILDSSSGLNNIGTFDTPSYIIYPDLTDIVGMAILWTNIPFTYFVIDDTCNTMTFHDNFTNTDVLLTIPAGTYNSVTIAQQLNLLLAAGLSSGVQWFTFFVNPDNSRLSCYNNGASSSTSFTLSVPAGSYLGTVLGLATGITLSSSTSTVTFVDQTGTSKTNYFFEGQNIVNLSGPNQVYIHSSLASATYGAVRSQTNSTDLIGFVPVTANYGGYIETIVSFPQMIPMTKSNITQMSFYLSLGGRTQYSTYNNLITAGTYQSEPATGTVNYLPLQGENWQIAIRFYQLDSTNQYVAAESERHEPQSIFKGRRGPGRHNVMRR